MTKQPTRALTPAELSRLEERLSRAKIRILLDHPFVGNVMLGMRFEFDAAFPTAATDGQWVKFNPEFVAKLTDPQLQFLVAHEVLHPMLMHVWRMKGRDRKLWNMAADYVINQMLVDDKIGEFIPGGCLDKTLHDAGGGYSEGIYAILQQQGDKGGGKGGKGGAGDIGGPGEDLVEPDGDEATQAADEAHMRVKVAQAANAARMAGKLSAGAKRFIDDLLNPRVDWKDVLREFVTKVRTDLRTFARPNRRFLQHGLYLPSRTGEVMGDIAVAVDCSGSVGNRELTIFATEITSIIKDCSPANVHVVYFDSEVCHYDVFARGEDATINAHGGGGTAFSPIFRFLDRNGIEPAATVVLTDLCCSDFGSPPDHPVLWVSTMKGSAPWGRVIEMKEV